jgi:hypothetical protein
VPTVFIYCISAIIALLITYYFSNGFSQSIKGKKNDSMIDLLKLIAKKQGLTD